MLPNAKIMNKPHLLPGLEFIYMAFFDLNTERPSGMGEGQIPWSAIKAYADYHELDAQSFEVLNYLIRRMDGVYLKHMSEKREQQSKQREVQVRNQSR